MCLNRYYVAEGVRLYSQQTWEEVMGNRGREEVARVLPQVSQMGLSMAGGGEEVMWT
jgi:hypothetical protein